MWNQADWQALAEHAKRCKPQAISKLITAEPARATAFSHQLGPLYFNFARQHFDATAMQDMLQRLQASGIVRDIQDLINGEKINQSENRAVMHMALRSDLGQGEFAKLAHGEAMAALDQLEQVSAKLAALGVTDVLSVGIGGSDLGPRLVMEALAGQGTGQFRVHFLSSADGMYLEDFMARLNPETTAILLVSKSFNTQETLINGTALKAWSKRPELIFAITANNDRAQAFDVALENILPIWDWVGGRFSVWSAVAFSCVLALGMPVFREFLRGAAAMDAHFVNTPVASNVVMWQALTSVWNRNAMGYNTQAIIPYDERLAMLPDHLQQVLMESLGKSVQLSGEVCEQATSPVLMGASGNPSQHSFFQYLQQGMGIVPIDFIGVVQSAHCQPANHHFILANLLAQAESLANGQHSTDSHKHYPGNRPSTVILMESLTPYSLGMLMALYEHSVFVQSKIWGINAFDQWGVELGKQIANGLMPYVEGQATADSTVDPITRELLTQLLKPSA